MPLQLTYRSTTEVPVEVPGIVPDKVRALSLVEIERLPIFYGNQRVLLADLFTVRGQGDDGRIDFDGDLSGVHWIGAGMTEGTVVVHGNAGRHVGSEMTGGSIEVAGNASDWVGGEMHGGLIRIRGNAGNLIGAAYRGSRRGMTGGTLLVGGNVGDEIGHTMRRGLLAVAGNCGDFAGINMIAGTILVFDSAGIRLGAGMRRGTIGVMGRQRPELLPTFRPGARARILVLELVLRELRKLNFAFDPSLLSAEYQLSHGDLLTTGRGEVVWPEMAR